MSFISNFFIQCSGANKEILKEIPESYLGTEKTKFVGIGGAIFFTACLAFVSSAFALSTFVKDVNVAGVVIDKLAICISFGILWAFMIFNLDRYIVSSMRKEGTWTSQLIRATPRILIALLFAVVISKPLELEIFRTEIEAQLPQSANKQTAYIQEAIDSLSQDLVNLRSENDTLRKNPFDSEFVKSANKEFESATSSQDSISRSLSPEIKEIDNKIYELTVARNAGRNRIRQFNTRIGDLTRELNDTVNVVTDAYSKREEIKKLKSDRWRDKLVVKNANDNLPALKTQKEKLQTQLDANQKEVEQAYEKLEVEKKEIGTIVKEKIAKNKLTILDVEKRIHEFEAERKLLNDKFTGLLARLKALDDLKSAEGNFVILIASTLVFLIFLAIEMAPVLVKLMSKRTMYDQILEEYEMPIPNKEILNEKINGFFKEDARLIKKKKKILRNFYAKKLALQEDFLNKSLARIKEMEHAKFEKNLDEYTSFISDNPDSYLQTFKSNSSPVTRRDGAMVWEDDDELKSGWINWFSWQRAGLIGLAVVLLTSTVLGINHFVSRQKPKEAILNQDNPTVKTPEELSIVKEETAAVEEVTTPELLAEVEEALPANDEITSGKAPTPKPTPKPKVTITEKKRNPTAKKDKPKADKTNIKNVSEEKKNTTSANKVAVAGDKVLQNTNQANVMHARKPEVDTSSINSVNDLGLNQESEKLTTKGDALVDEVNTVAVETLGSRTLTEITISTQEKQDSSQQNGLNVLKENGNEKQAGSVVSVDSNKVAPAVIDVDSIPRVKEDKTEKVRPDSLNSEPDKSNIGEEKENK